MLGEGVSGGQVVGECLLGRALKVLWVQQLGDPRAAAKWEMGEEREREGFHRVCLWNLNWIPITILKEIQGN